MVAACANGTVGDPYRQLRTTDDSPAISPPSPADSTPAGSAVDSAPADSGRSEQPSPNSDAGVRTEPVPPAAGSGGQSAASDAAPPSTESDPPAKDAAVSDASTVPPPKPLDLRAVQTDSPFGIAPSASSTYVFDVWAPMMAAIGVRWVRNFETAKAEERLATAKANQIQVSGILQWSASNTASFPVDNLAGWRSYVRALVMRCKGEVKYWEVWNEPPNFSANKSPSDYAKIVIAAYEEVKAVDPTIQLGIATRSNNVNFLDQALVAGAAAHFDYVTVHPYELLDLLSTGWEPVFVRIVPTLRRMLAARDPARAMAPIWFTEVGQPVTAPVTPMNQADSVIQAYTLGIAQGVARVEWFEGVDGDSGPFGLVSSDGQPRPSYTALKSLTANLGPNPRYFGWVLLNSKHYAFVFEGPRANLMVTWARPKTTEALTFDPPVTLITPATGTESNVSTYTLTPSPVILSGITAKYVDEAVANRMRAFPWSGDTPPTGWVSYVAPSMISGLHVLGDAPFVTVGSESARDQSGTSAHSFAVDPSYLSYDRVTLQVAAIVRRRGAMPAGFNLKYESATGWKNVGGWYGIPVSDQWSTAVWTITDPQFVGDWGYNLVLDSDSTVHAQYLLKSMTVTKQ
jgi:hypothetical protein